MTDEFNQPWVKKKELHKMEKKDTEWLKWFVNEFDKEHKPSNLDYLCDKLNDIAFVLMGFAIGLVGLALAPSKGVELGIGFFVMALILIISSMYLPFIFRILGWVAKEK